jgi:hypothetical protein
VKEPPEAGSTAYSASKPAPLSFEYEPLLETCEDDVNMVICDGFFYKNNFNNIINLILTINHKK